MVLVQPVVEQLGQDAVRARVDLVAQGQRGFATAISFVLEEAVADSAGPGPGIGYGCFAAKQRVALQSDVAPWLAGSG